MSRLDAEQAETLRSLLSCVRPRIETGYENMLVTRLAAERIERVGRVDAQELLRDWGPRLRDECLARFGESKEGLVAFFGETRDDLIRRDREAWLRLNAVYPFVREAFERSLNDADFYIVTTKQRRFVREIMEFNGLRCPPDDLVFDLDSEIRGKANVLRHILEQSKGETTLHFVEDRLETLRTVADTEGLGSVRLYLADWGYNLEEERRSCESDSRIELLRPEGFARLATMFTGQHWP